MQTIAVLAVFAAIMCIATGSPGDVFPQKAVWESIDLNEVLRGLSNEAKQEFSTIHNNTKATLAETRRAEKEWAKKFGVENQWNDFINRREDMMSKTAELLRKLPELYEQYRATWKGDESRENIEKNQKELRDKHKKEFFILNFAKELVERSEHKFKFN